MKWIPRKDKKGDWQSNDLWSFFESIQKRDLSKSKDDVFWLLPLPPMTTSGSVGACKRKKRDSGREHAAVAAHRQTIIKTASFDP